MKRHEWLVALALAAACNSSTSPKSASGCPACTHPAGQIYHTDTLGTRVYAAAATSNGTVLVSLPDRSQIGRIVLPNVGTLTVDQVGLQPADISLDSSQTHAFVTDETSNQIIEVDIGSGAHIATIRTTGSPFVSLLSANGNTLYTGTNTNSVYAIPLSNPTTSASIAVDNAGGGAPQFMTLSPDGTTLYVSTRTGGTVVEINTQSFSVIRTLAAGGTSSVMQQVVISPDGQTVYAVNENGNLYVWNSQSGALTDSVALGGQAWAMAMTPDAQQLYVSLLNRGAVRVLDRASLSTVMTLNTGGIPRRIAFAQQGKIAVIADEAGFIHFVD